MRLVSNSLRPSKYNQPIHGEEMNTVYIVIILGVIIIAIILIIVATKRFNRNLMRRVQEMQEQEPDFAAGFRNSIEIEANVISKSETIFPNAGGYAKVDLQVMIQLPDNAPSQVTTCWLVEVGSLDLVLPGRKVPVKVDPHKTLKIIPNVPWAKPWIFGK
jgi:hypothetical protein